MIRATPDAKFIVFMSSLKDKPFVFVYQVGDIFELWSALTYTGVQQHHNDYNSIMDAIRGSDSIT